MGRSISDTFDRRKILRYFGLLGLSALTPPLIRPEKILGGHFAKTGLDPGFDFILVNAALSGEYSFEGRQQLMATRMALDEINARGIFPRPLKVLVSDNKCLVGATENSIRQAFGALDPKRVVAIIGGSSSKISRLQSEVAQHLGILHLDGIAQLSSQGARAGISTFLSVEESAIALFKDLKARNVLAISHDYDWGRAQVEAQEREAKQRWISYTNEFVPLHHNRAALHEVDEQAKTADAIVINQYGKDLLTTLSYVKPLGLPIYLPVISDSMRAMAPKGLLDGVSAVVNWTELAPSSSSASFLREFQARFNESPGQAAQQAYGQLALFAEAYARAKSLEGSRLAAAIPGLQLEDFVGMNLEFRAGEGRARKDAYLVTFGADNAPARFSLIPKSALQRAHV